MLLTKKIKEMDGVYMDFRTLVFSGFIAALAYPSSAEDGKIYWILEAVAPIRSQPKLQAEVNTSLRCGTAFSAQKRTADWIYLDNMNGKGGLGWVQASMVSETKVDSSSILNQFGQAKSFADSIKWCERLVSLLPDNKPYMKALQKGYLATGNTAKAAYYGRELRGTNPVYLAHYQGKDLLVIGFVDSTGEFQNLLWQASVPDGTPSNETERAIKKKAMGLRISLASMIWYTSNQGSDRPILLPKVVPKKNNMDGYDGDVDGISTFGISLGSSNEFYSVTQEEVVFATKPVYRVPVSGIKRSTESDSLAWYKKQLVGNGFDSSGMTNIEYRALPEYGYVDIRIGGTGPNGYPALDLRGVFNNRGKLAWPPEGTAGTEGEINLGTVRAVPRWFRFGPNASFPAFIIVPFEPAKPPPSFNAPIGNYGYQLLQITGTGLKAFTVWYKSSGC